MLKELLGRLTGRKIHYSVRADAYLRTEIIPTLEEMASDSFVPEEFLDAYVVVVKSTQHQADEGATTAIVNRLLKMSFPNPNLGKAALCYGLAVSLIKLRLQAESIEVQTPKNKAFKDQLKERANSSLITATGQVMAHCVDNYDLETIIFAVEESLSEPWKVAAIKQMVSEPNSDTTRGIAELRALAHGEK
jgi:hypothetical protein